MLSPGDLARLKTQLLRPDDGPNERKPKGQVRSDVLFEARCRRPGKTMLVDGARPWQRFWHITWPLLLPVTMVVVLFSVIQTFSDFQIVYVMTGGGPANATHRFATYAYQIGIGTGLLSEGPPCRSQCFRSCFWSSSSNFSTSAPWRSAEP